jgi:hypothetical protein
LRPRGPARQGIATSQLPPRKADAGVKEHREHKKLTGRAWLAAGRILAPTGTTRRQLYVLAHECGHIALHSAPKARSRPTHVKEHEAECYAHRALTAHGLEVPEISTRWARAYVAQCIEEDRALGISICPMAEAFANGTRSPYAFLPAVEAHRRRKASAGDAISCSSCRYRSGSQCTVYLKRHSYAWRGACGRGQSWRPRRRTLLAGLADALVGMISGRDPGPMSARPHA